MSTQYDDPNRESVGLEPIWTGADVVVEPVATKSTKSSKGKDKDEVEFTPLESTEAK